MKKISQLPNYTGNTRSITLVCNDSGNTETFQIKNDLIYGGIGVSYNNTSPAYYNLTNGIDNYIPFNNVIFNTNINIFELVNPGINSNIGTRIFIKVPGIYEITSQIHLFDLFNNVDVLIKISTSNTSNGSMTPITLLNDCKFAELTSDRLLNSTYVFEVLEPSYFTVCINPSANSPFFSDANLTPTRIFIKKII